MANITKLALEAALKKELLTKPLDKITINELAEDCGISRMAFYYHFKDIYDLVEWVCVEDGTKALQGKKTYENWQEGFCQIFEAVLENKPFIMNVYRCVDRQKIESYLNKLTYQLIADFYRITIPARGTTGAWGCSILHCLQESESPRSDNLTIYRAKSVLLSARC